MLYEVILRIEPAVFSEDFRLHERFFEFSFSGTPTGSRTPIAVFLPVHDPLCYRDMVDRAGF